MSKKIIIITCLICLSFSISAQTERGHWLLNPQFTAFDLSGTNNDLDKDNRFKLGMGFKGGNFLCDRLALLVGVGFKVDRQNDYKDNSINLNTGLRYYLFSKLYLSAELGYDKVWLREYSSNITRKRDYFYFGADLGYSIFVSQNVAIEPDVYWKYSFTDQRNEYGFKIGIGVFL